MGGGSIGGGSMFGGSSRSNFAGDVFKATKERKAVKKAEKKQKAVDHMAKEAQAKFKKDTEAANALEEKPDEKLAETSVGRASRRFSGSVAGLLGGEPITSRKRLSS
jgi:hypothetical protein